jgi:hypothetical protein
VRESTDLAQSYSVTPQPRATIQVNASPCVIDPAAVVEAALAAVAPDRVLGKDLRKRRVELPSIHPFGNGCNDLSYLADRGGKVVQGAIFAKLLDQGKEVEAKICLGFYHCKDCGGFIY